MAHHGLMAFPEPDLDIHSATHCDECTTMMDSGEILKALVGSWTGTCRTWFRPDELADESIIKGEFRPILGANVLRHEYESTIQQKPRNGEEVIAFNSVSGRFQTTWIDDFHMSYGIMFSEGDPTSQGFCVNGKYDVGPGEPCWGWKTVFEMTDDGRLTITSYNIAPTGEEAMAIETEYGRVQ